MDLGDEKDLDEIIDIASKASVSDQQKQVQENIHSQYKIICKEMDRVLLPDEKNDSASKSHGTRRPSGLSWAGGRKESLSNQPDPYQEEKQVGDEEAE